MPPLEGDSDDTAAALAPNNNSLVGKVGELLAERVADGTIPAGIADLLPPLDDLGLHVGPAHPG